ncbi:MAG: type II toxin-antitoxin system Phd/YefM family antitoxin [Candidatus Roizmanbacteria bacterium]|nr:type II toxin-antitoxin system Phd/YefM family antitoxin [Candidatus Roizmanbacteria bacterium]
MNTKTTMSITEARKQFFDISDQVQNPGVYFTLTEKGRPKVVIMSAEEFASWHETREVIQDFPDLNKEMKAVDVAVKSGEYKNWVTLETVMAKYGYVLADKGKKQYGLGNKTRKKSTKRS